MDFLWLFVLYVSVLVGGVCVFCGMSARSRRRLDAVFYRAEEAMSYVLPAWLYRRLTGCFRTRNAAFVLLHLALDVLAFGEYVWEVQDKSLEMQLPRPVVFLPYALMTVNLYFFYKCCTTDPGVITKAYEPFCIRFYQYDNLMFHPGRKCETCDLLKPARSKHCDVCGVCVQRFDHHCVWVNNCIGGQNIRYFLLYLTSLSLTALTMAGVIAGFLLQVALLTHMSSAAYVDDKGHEEPVDIVLIIQLLFLAFPRIVLALGFLLTVTLFLGCYACFMWYLCLTNLTTNEWYKARSLRTSSTPVSITTYSRGMTKNLQEIFQPCICYKKKQRAS